MEEYFELEDEEMEEELKVELEDEVEVEEELELEQLEIILKDEKLQLLGVWIEPQDSHMHCRLELMKSCT